MRSKLATITAAITVLAVAAPGATGAAQAAPAKPLTGKAPAPRTVKAKPRPKPKAPAAKRVRHTKRAPGAPLHTVVKRGTVVAVTAGATGTGPATQKECDAHARLITSDLDNAANELIDGNDEAADVFLESAEANTNLAMDRGCFIVY